jgi:hypothetical protein
LDASASSDADGDPLTYRWTTAPGTTLSGATTTSPSFVALNPGVYAFVLVVSDGFQWSLPDTTLVRVTANRIPLAEAGPDQSVRVGATVTLDGGNSSDPDGDALTYAWSAPVGLVLSDAHAPRPTLTTGAVGDYPVVLVVSDGVATSAADTITITVTAASSDGTDGGVVVSITTPRGLSAVGPGSPVAVGLAASRMVGVKQYEVTLEVTPPDAFDLGATTFVYDTDLFSVSPGVYYPAGVGGGQVQAGAAAFGTAINGTGSLGTFTLRTAATFTAGKSATIRVVRVSMGPSSTSRTVFAPPQIDLQVAVNGEMVANAAPVADAGRHQSAATGTLVRLDGSGSHDADGDALTYSWTAPTNVTLSDAHAAQPTFTAGASGDYRFQLVVSDGLATSMAASVTVTVAAVPPPDTTEFSGPIILTTPSVLGGFGPGAAVTIGLAGRSVANVKQFEVALEVEPAGAFDLSQTQFAPNEALFPISPGPFYPDGPNGNRVQAGAASFGNAVNGHADLGTFTLTTAETFTPQSRAVVRVTRVSLGPTSTARTVYTAAEIGLAVTITGGASASGASIRRIGGSKR